VARNSSDKESNHYQRNQRSGKAVVRRHTEEVQGGGNFEVFEELLRTTPCHTPQPGGTPDKAGARKLYHALRGAFPDFHAVIIADGRREIVTTFKTYHGTHKGRSSGLATPQNHFDTVDASVFKRQDHRAWACEPVLSHAAARRAPADKKRGNIMKRYLVILLLTMLWSPAMPRNATIRGSRPLVRGVQHKNTALLDKILADTWIDIPSNPRIPMGARKRSRFLIGLTTVVPDFNIVIQDILQDGNKVVVRSEITGTQRETFAGFLIENRRSRSRPSISMNSMDGKIVRPGTPRIG